VSVNVIVNVRVSGPLIGSSRRMRMACGERGERARGGNVLFGPILTFFEQRSASNCQNGVTTKAQRTYQPNWTICFLANSGLFEGNCSVLLLCLTEHNALKSCFKSLFHSLGSSAFEKLESKIYPQVPPF
jgi:hypothetical protein